MGIPSSYVIPWEYRKTKYHAETEAKTFSLFMDLATRSFTVHTPPPQKQNKQSKKKTLRNDISSLESSITSGNFQYALM